MHEIVPITLKVAETRALAMNHVHVCQTSERAAEKLAPYGIRKEQLPQFLGGTWDPSDIDSSIRREHGLMNLTCKDHPARFSNVLETLAPPARIPGANIQSEKKQKTPNQCLKGLNVDVDVLLGRGRIYCSMPGNRRYQSIIEKLIDQYEKSNSRKQIKCLKEEVFSTVKESTGRFMEFDGKSNEWVEVCTSHALEKIGQAFRSRQMRRRKTKK